MVDQEGHKMEANFLCPLWSTAPMTKNQEPLPGIMKVRIPVFRDLAVGCDRYVPGDLYAGITNHVSL